MIRLYIKNYRYRLGPVISMLLVLLALLFFNTLVNSKNITKANDIFDSYKSYAFNYGYILSSKSNLDNEALYPDTDILFYKDEQKKNKIVASSIMQESAQSGNYFNIFDFNAFSHEDEAILPYNVAMENDIKVGDIIYCDYSFTNDLIPTKVILITSLSAYDFSDNAVENDVGIIALSYKNNYANTTNCNYVLLSENSAIENLSKNSVPIKTTFSKITFQKNSKEIIIVPSIINLIVLAIVGALYLIFSKKTTKDLKALINKGLQMSVAKAVLILESLVLYALPASITELLCNGIFLIDYKLYILLYFLSLLLTYIIVICILLIRLGHRRLKNGKIRY